MTDEHLSAEHANLWQAIKRMNQDMDDARDNFQATLILLDELRDQEQKVYNDAVELWKAIGRRLDELKKG